MRKAVIPLLIALLLTGCKDRTQENPPRTGPRYGGTYRAVLDFRPRTLDPAKATDIYSVTIIQQIFDGLLTFDKELNLVPAIARSWKISRDGKTYTFFLKRGVRFHNGREVTAEDFVYSFTRIIDPRTGSPGAALFEKVLGAKEFREGKAGAVKGLKALSKYVLEIKLTEPFAPFLTLLGMYTPKVIPKEEVERWGDDFGRHPVGTGPFRLSSWEGDRIVLEANRDYFKGRPYLDRIVYRVFPGARYDQMYDEFLKGRLEESPIPSGRREEALRGGFRVIRRPLLNLLYYGLNVRTPPFNNIKVRQALNLAIDRERIVKEALRGKDVKAERILPPGMPGYSPGRKAYPYDPARARRLLEEAGYPGGRGLPVLEIWSASRAEATRKELEIIKANLADIGIRVRIRYEDDWPTYEELLLRRRLPFYRYAWYADFPDPDNFLAILFHSKAKYNFSLYHNSKVDLLLDKAKRELDPLRRVEMYREAEDLILTDAPIIPILHRTFEMAYQPYVRGIEVSPLGGPYIPMKKVWLEKIPP